MGAIDQIVNISISQLTKGVSQASFAIPLILGRSARFNNADIIRYYSSTAAMLSDGFTSSDPEYKFAVALLGQTISPAQFAVGLALARVAQVDTITPTAVDNKDYKVTLDGVDYTFNSGAGSTATTITTGLKSLINADANAACAATGTATLILTAKVTGAGFVTSTNANTSMALVHTTASYGPADDLAAISLVSNLWYGVAFTSHDSNDVKQVASYIESVQKIFGTSSSNAGVPSAGFTTDILSYLKGKSYNRTFLVYSGDDTDGPESAWMGGELPKTPGSSTWKFKQLVGITPDVLTDTQRNTIIGTPGVAGKNGNIYESVGGVNITEEGWMVSGQFIDQTVGVDWLHATMQANIYSVLVNNDKVPYTDVGAAAVEQAIRQTLQQGVTNGLIDGASPIVVTVPLVASVSTNNRANRILPNITWSCRLAGALHFVVINGVVTV